MDGEFRCAQQLWLTAAAGKDMPAPPLTFQPRRSSLTTVTLAITEPRIFVTLEAPKSAERQRPQNYRFLLPLEIEPPIVQRLRGLARWQMA